MSRQTTVLCDRCKTVCVADASMIEATAGALLNALPERRADLCSDCATGLLDWLRAGKPELPSTLPLDATPARRNAAEPSTDVPAASTPTIAQNAS